MIEYFDTYVRTDTGFVAVKGDLVVICDQKYGHTKGSYEAAFYCNRQTHTRAIAWCGTGTRRWVREHAVSILRKLHAKRIRK